MGVTLSIFVHANDPSPRARGEEVLSDLGGQLEVGRYEAGEGLRQHAHCEQA